MSHINVTIIGNEDMYGRNAVAFGITHILSNNYSTTVFRPCAQPNDTFTKQLLGITNTSAKLEQVIATTPEIVRTNKDTVRGDIVARYNELLQSTSAQASIIVSSDANPAYDPELFSFDATVAADLASPVFLTVSAQGLSLIHI